MDQQLCYFWWTNQHIVRATPHDTVCNQISPEEHLELHGFVLLKLKIFWHCRKKKYFKAVINSRSYSELMMQFHALQIKELKKKKKQLWDWISTGYYFFFQWSVMVIQTIENKWVTKPLSMLNS